jgi:hypothetical protein
VSQSGVLTVVSGGGPIVETLTGNSGGAVGPDGSFNINVLGNNSSGINIVGNPATNTLTVTAFQATTSQEGTITLATNAQTIAGANTANAVVPSSLAAKLGTQTAHSLAVFEGTSAALTALGAATNGQIPIGSTGADPVLNTITGGTGITVTNGAGTITIAADGAHVLETLTGNSGGAISPTAGNINTVGTGNITIAGAGSTLTTQLTGLTNHAIQIGAGTATLTQLGAGTTGQVLQTNTGADPTWSTATYPSTTTINQLLYSSSANTVTGLSTANQGVLTTGATGIPVITALATNGQLIIGSTAGVPAAATLTPGTGISITNGSNSITISATGTTTLTYTSVNHAASPYTVLAADDFIGVDSTAGVVSILLPNAPATGRVVIVKDSKAQAVANNITVTTVGGAVTIDGATTYVMKTNYQSVQLIFNGTSYEVF